MGKITPTLLVLVLSSSCFGYIRQVTNVVGDTSPVPLFRTDNTGIQFLLNANVAAGLQSSASGNNVTVISAGSNPQAAVRAALATWNAVGTANVRFLPLQSTNLSINPTDNNMVIAVGATTGDLSAVGNALAVTVDYYSPIAQVINGVSLPKGAILDSDIILNPAPTYAFSTDGSTSIDLQSVMTHELGHSLSANHTGLLGASMFQYNSGQRFLTADDLTFVNAAYPLASGGPALGTISGIVTATGGVPVPYALLTAFDTSAGVTVGGITNPDGTYSMQVPAGNYQLYAEPLNGVLAINIYLTAAQAALAARFQTTFYNGSLSVAGGGAANANIAVTPGTSGLGAPIVAVTPVNGAVSTGVIAGPLTVPSGGSVDLVLAGAGYDGTLTNANFAFYGQGVELHPGSVRVDKSQTFGPYNLLRVTLDVAATATPSLASFVVTSGASVDSFSGALIIVPPTPTFVSNGVISAAAFTGIQGGVSPGGIYSIYDVPNAPNLGPAAYVVNGGYDAYSQLATVLGGVSVTFDGVPAPMFLSAASQLNFQVPFEVAGKTSTQVVVNYLGSASASIAVPVLRSQPSFFTVNSDGKTAIAVNLVDHKLNTAQNPAARGAYVEVYGTGIGKVSYTVFTGQGAPGFPAGFTGNYVYSVGGSAAAPALFGGWTPTAVGLAQWDLQIPASSPTGAVSLIVRDASGATSQSGATIFVK